MKAMQASTHPLVSIIVPCYNYARFLPETLQSILDQEYYHWECIIVNDGSTDGTEAVAMQYQKKDARFKYIYQHNKGLSSARNTGIINSKGEYLQFLDSDDTIHASKIKLQVSFLQDQSNVDIVYGNSLFFNSDCASTFFQNREGKLVDETINLKKSGSGPEILSKLLVNNMMEVSCALIKKEIIEKVGFFNEAYKSYEDWEFWIRCAIAGCYFYYLPIDGTETYIRCGHSSMMTNKKKLTAAGIKIRQFVKPYLSPRQSLYNNYRLAKLYLRTIFNIY